MNELVTEVQDVYGMQNAFEYCTRVLTGSRLEVVERSASTIVRWVLEDSVCDMFPAFHRYMRRLILDGELRVNAVIGVNVLNARTYQESEMLSRPVTVAENVLAMIGSIQKLRFPVKGIPSKIIRAVCEPGAARTDTTKFIAGDTEVTPLNEPFVFANCMEPTEFRFYHTAASGVRDLQTNHKTLGSLKAGKVLPIISYHTVSEYVSIRQFGHELYLAIQGFPFESLESLLKEQFSPEEKSVENTALSIAEKSYKSQDFFNKQDAQFRTLLVQRQGSSWDNVLAALISGNSHTVEALEIGLTRAIINKRRQMPIDAMPNINAALTRAEALGALDDIQRVTMDFAQIIFGFWSNYFKGAFI